MQREAYCNMKTAIQLYTIRDGLLAHLHDNLTELKAIGYDGAEIFGLGKDTVLQVAAEMKAVGLEIFSIHTDLGEVTACDEEMLRAYAEVGCKYIPICWLPQTHIAGGENYIEMLGLITRFAARAVKYGIRVLYHNHDFDLAAYDGTTKLDALYRDTNPTVLGAELDTCWIYTAGYDPLAYLNTYADRCPVLHVKDCVEAGGHAGYRAIGEGVIDFAPIVAAAKEHGIPWVCVEQDEPSPDKTPMQCARESFACLQSLL